MQIEEIVTEVIIESDGKTREGAAAPGAVPQIDTPAVVELIEQIQTSDDRRERRLEVDE